MNHSSTCVTAYVNSIFMTQFPTYTMRIIITSILCLSELLKNQMRQYKWKALWKPQSGVINSCANTHNNFNSTDKSGINSQQWVVLLRTLQWSIFRIESSQWIGKCIEYTFERMPKLEYPQLCAVSSNRKWNHSTLQRWLLLYFNIHQFFHVLNICQLIF